MFKTISCLKICGLKTCLFWGFTLFQLMMDRNLILEPCNIFGHFVPPEDKQTQVENSSKTEKTTASYSSGLHWECLVSDVAIGMYLTYLLTILALTDMFSTITTITKSFRTIFTTERFFPSMGSNVFFHIWFAFRSLDTKRKWTGIIWWTKFDGIILQWI